MRSIRRANQRIAAAALVAFGAEAAALAQDERPTGYPRSANEGADKPVSVSAVYTGEVRGNVEGGIAQGARYLDNLDLQIALDAERLIGWQGARMFGYVLYNNGTPFSTRLVGDAQGVSNIETGVRAVRLFEAWVEQDLGARGSVKAGLYNLNSEFDTTISGGLFHLSSHGIGPDFSQSGENGPSIFPNTSLAVRGEYAADDHWLIRAAVLDGVPGDPARPRRTAVKLSARDGALLVGEVDRLASDIRVGLGTWVYTAGFETVEGPDDARSRGNAGAYAFVERQLAGSGKLGETGLAGWVRVGVANPRFNPVHTYLGAGLVRTGMGAGRPDDQLGLSIAAAQFGSRFRAAEAPAGREVIVEAAYHRTVKPWLTLQPDVQWVINPSGRTDLGDALVVGLRFKVGR